MKANVDDKVIKYNAKLREFSLRVSSEVVQCIDFCPWCATRLPDGLRKEWFEALEAVGVEDPLFEPDKIPAEFKTDEWWKKRSL